MSSTEIVVRVEHSEETLAPHEVARYGQSSGKQDDARITAWNVSTRGPV